MRRRIAAMAWGGIALSGAACARAELHAGGWPQARGDARLTARADEPALRDPEIAWVVPMGDFGLGAEMIAADCDLYVPVGHDHVERVNARSGQRAWLQDEQLTQCGSFRQHAAILALSDEPRLVATFPSDSRIAAVQADLCLISEGCGSHLLDNGGYPPGLDLPAELAPYIPWPVNACTGDPMIVSDVPSPGDVRYLRDPAGGYWLGAWWHDDGLFPAEVWCTWVTGPNHGLHPSWPVSAIPSGEAIALEPVSGTESWRARAPLTGWRLAVSGTADGFVLAGESDAAQMGQAHGLVRALRSDGTTAWEIRRMEGAFAQAARDPGTGALFVPFRPGAAAETFDRMADALSRGISGWIVDNSATPPIGELAPLLVPMFLAAMPLNPLTGLPARWSPVPSPGDYDYVATATTYEVSLWDGEGRRVSVWRDGARVGPWAVDEGTVESLTAGGARRWRTAFGQGVHPSSLLIDDQGSVVVVTSDGFVRALDPADGSERWTFPLPGPGVISSPGALLPDGGLVLGSAGDLLVVEPPGILRWEWSAPAGSMAAPVVTSDGIILVGDNDGVLHALRPDRSEAWAIALAVLPGDAIITPALVHDGLVHVGLIDGRLVTLKERTGAGMVPDPGGLLMARRAGPDEALLDWSSMPPPPVPGVHFHLRRLEGDPRLAGSLLTPHDRPVTELLDATPGLPLVFYQVTAADCGENESPR